MTEARTIRGEAGSVHESPVTDSVTAQWVMFPAGDDQAAVGIVMLDIEGLALVTIMAVSADTAREIVQRGMGKRDAVEPAFAAPLPQLRGTAAAIRCAENIARAAVSGRLPVFPLNPDTSDNWRSIVGMAVSIEERVN